MTDSDQRLAREVADDIIQNGRLLRQALDRWATRDDAKPHPSARYAANTAVDAIDLMLRDLHQVRQELVSEKRVFDDAIMASTEALLARCRNGAEIIPGALDEIEAEALSPLDEAASDVVGGFECRDIP